VSAKGKAEILKLVADSGLPRSRALFQFKLPRSTYYRWLQRLGEGRLNDKKGGSHLPWNKLRPEEEAKILTEARTSPELSCRQHVRFREHGLPHIEEGGLNQASRNHWFQGSERVSQENNTTQ